jgi:hypothetical protein
MAGLISGKPTLFILNGGVSAIFAPYGLQGYRVDERQLT